jgi:hypothetical protein
MLPSFLPSFLFAAPVALDKLVLDDERHILYSLAANSAIQVRCRRCAAFDQPARLAGLSRSYCSTGRLGLVLAIWYPSDIAYADVSKESPHASKTHHVGPVRHLGNVLH